MVGRSRDIKPEQGRGAPRAPVVAALDLGQAKVACFIMKPDGVRHADRTIRVAGASHVQSKGVKGGAIVNMDEAAQAILSSPVKGIVTGIQAAPGQRVAAGVGLITLQSPELARLKADWLSSRAKRERADAELARMGTCMAKTQLSLSHDPDLKGRPRGWTLPIRDFLVYRGAGFVVPVAGDIPLMPGTGSDPGFRRIDVDTETGRVKGLF